MKRFYLTCDVDPQLTESGEDWKSLSTQVKRVNDLRQIVEDQIGTALPLTWFARADLGVQKEYQILDFWLKKMQKSKRPEDEIGLHFHYSFKSPPSTENVACELERVLQELCAKNLLSPKVVSFRMGSFITGEQIWKVLSCHGFKIDSSVFPGRADEKLGYNWRSIGNEIYWSFKKVLQVPISTHSAKLSYDKITMPLRYVNPFFSPKVFKQQVQAFKQTQQNHLVLICHPFEVKQSSNKELFGSSPTDNFLENFSHLIQGLESKFSFSSLRTLYENE